MKGVLKVTDPDAIEFTLTITMPLGNWKRLMKQLEEQSAYPSWELKDLIRRMVAEAGQSFSGKEEIVE